MSKKLTVVQCWDDGVTNDLPLMDVLRRHGATASFNLNIGLHLDQRGSGWEYKGTEVLRLAKSELVDAYQGFTIANHTVSHPHLEQIPIEQATAEIVDGRKGLQDLFQAPILGFAYPFGTYNEAVIEAVAAAGHTYARTTKNVDFVVPPENPIALHSNCHFHAPDFWDRYEKAKACGVFYFWGHSYELYTDELWAAFDEQIARIAADPDSQWGSLEDLFPGQ